MSLDFFFTHFYRLVVHDVVLMSDVYWFYSHSRKTGKSISEFAEILSNLLEIESQNFEEINTAKLSIGGEESVMLIIWDYFHDVMIKHLLDDASQFPFWAAKIIVTSEPHKFGMPVIRAYMNCLTNIYADRGVRGLFEGCGPYVLASCYYNYKFLTKVTHTFIHNVFSKIPHPNSAPLDDDMNSPLGSPVAQSSKKKPNGFWENDASADSGSRKKTDDPPSQGSVGMVRNKLRSLADLSELSNGARETFNSARDTVNSTMSGAVTNAVQLVHNLAPEYAKPSSGKLPRQPSEPFIPTGPPPSIYKDGSTRPYSSVSALRAKKTPPPPRPTKGRSLVVRTLEKAAIALMTQPLLALATAMVTDPLYHGQNSVVAFFKMTANRGIIGLYSGFRSRVVVSLIPLSPLVMLGIADAVIYRRMLGQGTIDSTGGVLSVVKQIVSEGSVLSLLNYGLLTAVNIVPGFISFLTMRSLSWILMGSSIQRKHQITRRQDIVNAHLSLINKKSESE